MMTGQKIAFPDELCHKPVLRVPIDFRWCSDLKQFASVQDGDAVCDRDRLLLVVRDIDGGQSKLPADAANFLPHFQTQFRIQIGQWLVQEQARRPHDERSCESDALLLAAGHFMDFAPSQAPRAEQRGELQSLGDQFLPSEAAVPPSQRQHFFQRLDVAISA